MLVMALAICRYARKQNSSFQLPDLQNTSDESESETRNPASSTVLKSGFISRNRTLQTELRCHVTA